MAKSGGGFFEGILKDIAMIGAIEASRDSKGKADPYMAAGLAYGAYGDLSLSDHLHLGMLLGIDGAFDDDDDDDDSIAQLNARRQAEYISAENRNFLVNMLTLYAKAPDNFPQFMLRDYTARMRNFANSVDLSNIHKVTNAGFIDIATKAQSLLASFEDAVERHDSILDDLDRLKKVLAL